MGYAIADVAQKARCKCHFNIWTCRTYTTTWVQLIMVECAQDMYEAVMSKFAEADIVIKSAAVADYRPKSYVDHKIKKEAMGTSN